MKISEIPVLILAGGKGTRIKHLLSDLPKPMYPVLGKPFLEYQINFLKRFGFKKFYISTGYKAEVIESFFKQINQITCIKENEPLGTGGAFLNCINEINAKKILVLNGDTLFLMDFERFIEFSDGHNKSSVIALKKVNDSSRYGSVLVNERNLIINFSEKSNNSNALINAGVYLFDIEQIKLNEFPKVCSLEVDIIPKLIPHNIFGFEVESNFIDIGTPETLFQIEEFVITNNLTF